MPPNMNFMLPPDPFVAMWAGHYRIHPEKPLNRIESEYCALANSEALDFVTDNPGSDPFKPCSRAR